MTRTIMFGKIRLLIPLPIQGRRQVFETGGANVPAREARGDFWPRPLRAPRATRCCMCVCIPVEDESEKMVHFSANKRSTTASKVLTFKNF